MGGRVGPDLLVAEGEADGDLVIHLDHQRVLRVRVGVSVAVVGRRWLLENWRRVDVPGTRLLWLLLLITETLSSDGRRVLRAVVVVVTGRQATVLVVMVTVLDRLVLIRVHRLIVVVVFPDRRRGLAWHSLEAPPLPRRAIGLDDRAVALVAAVLVVARVRADALAVVPVIVGRAVVHHVQVAVRRRRRVVMVLME